MFSAKEMESIMRQLVRVGVVTSTNDEAGTAKVQFLDRSGVVSHDFRVLVRNTLKNKDYWMPDINEQVICVCLPTGTQEGFILGSFYSNKTTPPVTDKKQRHVEFEDGTTVDYDRETHTLTVDIPEDGGNVVVNAHTKVTVNSPAIDLGENSDLEPSVLGDKLAAWIEGELKPWLDDHTHLSASPGNPSGKAKDAPSGAFNAGNGANGGNIYSAKNRNQ